MDKLNDIINDLDENIDLASQYKLDKLRVSNLWKKNTLDFLSKKKIIDLSLNKTIKIRNLKTKFFDSFYSIKKEDKIDTITPKKSLNFFLNKIRLFFKKYYLLYKLRNKKKNRFGFNIKKKHKKIALFIIFLIFILILNKIFIEKLVTNWYDNILEIKLSIGDNNKIKSNIFNSRVNLWLANTLFKPFSFIPNENIKNVEYIIKWWKELSNLLNKSFNLYIDINKFIDEKWWPQNIYLTNLLDNLRDSYSNIYSSLYKSLYYYSKVGDLWNDNLNWKLNYAKENLRYALLFLDVFEKNYDTLLSILWHFSERKYLVLFQNNDEIRATWWFIWSTATITMRYWKVVNVEKNDVYALEWLINKVYTDKRLAPEWLNKITWTYWLRDANYYYEFKESANNIKYFLDKIDYKIDGVIFINQNIILDLLDLVWWVNSIELWKNITSDNFSLIISTLVEAKVFKVWSLWTPKQVLFDFSIELFDKLLTEKDYFWYFNILSKHIKTRDIVFYSFIPEENSLLWKLWVNWETNLNSTLDFNYPFYTSIWWNKTDRYIVYDYQKVIKNIENSCDFETNLTIYKTHNFSENDDKTVIDLLNSYWATNINDVLNIQWRWDNKSYLRIVLPKNIIHFDSPWQKLIEFQDYNILEMYTNTSRFETSRDIIRYNIINPDCKDYSFKFFKQPWKRTYNIWFDYLNKKTNYKNISTDFILKNN